MSREIQRQGDQERPDGLPPFLQNSFCTERQLDAQRTLRNVSLVAKFQKKGEVQVLRPIMKTAILGKRLSTDISNPNSNLSCFDRCLWLCPKSSLVCSVL